MSPTTERLSFAERARITQNPTAEKLFRLISEKQTNLAVNADVDSTKELLRLADLVGPHICVLKTHVDLLNDFDAEFPPALKKIAEKHRFLIFEDRKFADIGMIAKKQYQGGIYRIAEWADIINAHPVPGPGVIDGLKEVGLPLCKGLLLVAQMSSAGSLAHGSYSEAAIAMAEEHADFVIGFIAQRKLTGNPCFVHFTPGIKLTKGTDALGQRYTTPNRAIRENCTDVIIVGRGIIESNDPVSEAARYRKAGMRALEGLSLEKRD